MQNHSLLFDVRKDVLECARREPHSSVLVQKLLLGAGSPTARLGSEIRASWGETSGEKCLSSSLLTRQLTQHIACRGYGQPAR